MTSTVTTQSTSVHKPAAPLGDSVPVTAGGTLPESSTLSTDLYQSAIKIPPVTSSTSSSAGHPNSSTSVISGQQRPILPAPPRSPPPGSSASETKTNMSGLLNTKNLDEKLVVATLATLNSGTASSLIKQDLKWIIQSRRKAEGKSELQVEFKKPVKEEQLTSEEVVKRSRRRELNRLAARRSREKGQKRKDMLVEEIHKLQMHNTELLDILKSLTEQRNQIIDTLRQHMKQCSDYEATQKASVGLSHRVLSMLGVHTSETDSQPPEAPQLTLSVPPVSVAPTHTPAVSEVSGMSALYISTSELGSSPSQHSMSPGSQQIKKESGCWPPSPLVLSSDRSLGSLASFFEEKTGSTSPSMESVSLCSSANQSGEKFAGIGPLENPKIQDIMHSPSTNLELSEVPGQIFLFSPTDINAPLQLGSPSFLAYAVGKTTTHSNVAVSVSKKSSQVIDTKSWTNSLASVHAAVNFQIPVSKTGSPLVPILPKPSKIDERRKSSTASLSVKSEEGIALPVPYSSLTSSSPTTTQSAPSDSGLGSSQEEGGDGRGEEVVQYKHKLMKHRKQHSTDFTHPSRRGGIGGESKGAGGRPSLLERSFSFPSSRCEQLRSSSETFESQSNVVFRASGFSDSSHTSSSSVGFRKHLNSSKANPGITHMSLPTYVASVSKALASPLSSSLSSSVDLSALNTGSKKISSILKFHGTNTTDPESMRCLGDTAMEEERSADEGGLLHREIQGWASPMDTWPPAGSPRSNQRFPSRFPAQERRWSVDDYPSVPLNLSRRNSQDESFGVNESSHRTASSCSNSPTILSGNQRNTFNFSTDPYS